MRRKVQSGASSVFAGAAVFLWLLASLIAEFPKGTPLILAAMAVLCLVAALARYAWACWRR